MLSAVLGSCRKRRTIGRKMKEASRVPISPYQTKAIPSRITAPKWRNPCSRTARQTAYSAVMITIM